MTRPTGWAPTSCWPGNGRAAEPARRSAVLGLQDGLDDAGGALVELAVEGGRVVQPAMVGHDRPRPRPAGQDEVAEQHGVPAVVGAAEADRDALAEERGPRHGQPSRS